MKASQVALQNGLQSKSQAVTLSYSFDYAQQLHYPSDPLQPGILYFKTPRKCGIFWVCAEGSNTQLNYLIDKAQSCGKGAISMIHHNLQYSNHAEKICLQADNCVAQNIVAFYLMWRVMMGLNQSCELGFMLVGHTRFENPKKKAKHLCLYCQLSGHTKTRNISKAPSRNQTVTFNCNHVNSCIYYFTRCLY